MVLLSALTIPPVHAQTVPQLINYQGRLSDSNGAPLATKDYQLTFNIYDTNNGGTLIWGPQIFEGSNGLGHGLKIPVVQGYFNVMLGPTDISNRFVGDAFNATNRFVEITVETNKAISPRQQILTAPFAFNSAKLAGVDWSVVFGTNDPVNGKIPGTNLANGTITSNQVALATIGGAQIASNSIAYDRLAARSVSTNGTNLAVGGIAISPSCGTFTSPTPTAATTVPNLSVTIVPQSNPVEVTFVSDGVADNSYFEAQASSSAFLDVILLRDSIVAGIEHYYISPGATGAVAVNIPPSAFRFLDTAAQAGVSHTYTAQIRTNPSGTVANAVHIKMMAREL